LSKLALLESAQDLAARLPKLILAAERLAFIAAPGLHGRRRGGHGDSFWQFRDWQNGDDSRQIDWRRSARGDRLYFREKEWEAQASIALSLENTPSLAFHSSNSLPTKWERAVLLLLALASILARSGERVALAGVTPPLNGRTTTKKIAEALLTGGTAQPDPQARHIRFGDFLKPADFTAPAGGAVLQILDPAECDFPYSGRVVFEGMSGEPSQEASNAAEWRKAYQARMTAHRQEVANAAIRAGQTALFHRTDHPPAAALATLFQALLHP
jgi:uncharacterized protein (DUF58 family)